MDDRYNARRLKAYEDRARYDKFLASPYSFSVGYDAGFAAADEPDQEDSSSLSIPLAPFKITSEAQRLCGEILTLLGATNLPVADKASALRRVACLLDGGPNE